MSASDLENCINSLGHWLVFWTLVVAAGLVIGYAKPVTEFFVSAYKWAFRTGSRPHLDHVIVGGLLITIGVAAEGWVEFRASRAETALRTENNKSFVNLGNLVDKAQHGADDAAKRASDAKHSAQQADSEARNAKRRAEEIAKQAAELRKQNLDLAQKLASTEKAAFPRYLRQKEFAEKIKPFKGFPVFIETISDFEARRTAALIHGGLSMAEWDVHPVVTRVDEDTIISFGYPGVSVEETCNLGRSYPESSLEEWRKAKATVKACIAASDALLKALNENGIEAHFGVGSPWPQPNTIMVRVALKPMPGNGPPKGGFFFIPR